jgi:hypothetical protein
MSLRSRWSGLAGAAIPVVVVCACSIPLEVHRVADPGADVKGVRFLVKRPAYEASLRLDETTAPCQFRLSLVQTLAGSPIEYEAVGKARLLAATELRLTEDARGELSAVSAAESDQTHEIVEALAGITTSFAPLPGARATRGELRPPCEGLPREGAEALSQYILEHRAMAARLAAIRDAVAQKLSKVDAGTGSAKVRSIEALDDLADDLEEEWTRHVFPLTVAQFRVVLAGEGASPARQIFPVVRAPEALEPWFTITLTPETAR